MIETHVVNASLSPALSSETFFQYLKFVNGLVAPSFLFASGLSYAVATHRKIPDYLSFSSPLFQQMRRLLTVAIIGYLLHVPLLPVWRMATEATPEQWQSFFQVDILQCIAVSLLILQILLLITRSESRLYKTAFGVAAAVVVLSPYVWQIDYWEQLPWIAAGYMNGIRFSLFPLFPWLSFLFAGALAGYMLVRTTQDLPRYSSTLAWAGGSMILLSYLADSAGAQLLPPHNYWQTSPAFFLLRLGIVMLLGSLLVWSSTAGSGKFRAPVLLFGQESLLVYVAHLLILYGDFGEFNLQKSIGGTFGYVQAGLLSSALIALMWLAAVRWHRIKRESPRLKRFVTTAAIVTVAGLLLFGEG